MHPLPSNIWNNVCLSVSGPLLVQELEPEVSSSFWVKITNTVILLPFLRILMNILIFSLYTCSSISLFHKELSTDPNLRLVPWAQASNACWSVLGQHSISPGIHSLCALPSTELKEFFSLMWRLKTIEKRWCLCCSDWPQTPRPVQFCSTG